MHRRLITWLISLLSCAPAWSTGLWQPSTEAKAALTRSVLQRHQRLFADGQLKPRMTSIDAAGIALDAAAAGQLDRPLDDALAAIRSLQDNNFLSPTRNNIRWYQGDAQIVDRNGIEFVTRKAALLWLLYGEQLRPPQREALRDFLKKAADGITQHRVNISYTNIWLMKCWNLIALGEGLNDEALARQGYGMLSDWLARAQHSGIDEYLSPNYYEVDLENLALVYNLSRNPHARTTARAALDMFWLDVALNWYAPANRLGGTHSRDYDRLFNVGGLNHLVEQAGWSGPPRAPLPAEAPGPYEALSWAPPPEQASSWLRAPLPRLVSARWGDAPERRYTHYLGRAFDIATSEAGYPSGHDNSPLVINLGGGQDVPVINFFMDGRHDYYGQNKTLEAGSGHMKALHLRPFLSSAQNEREALFMAWVRMQDKPEYTALESVLTLPADAEYWLDDKRLDLFTASTHWRNDPDGNGSSTLLKVTDQEGHPELQMADRDDRLGVGVSQVFAVQAGESYRLASSLQGGEVYLYLNFLDANKQLIGPEHARRVSGGANSFQNQEYQWTAPAGAAWCKAWLYSTSSNRTELRVRDLRFEQLTAGTARLLGSFDFAVHRPQSIDIPAGSTLFVRRGDAAAALRLLGAWNLAGQPIGLTLHNDGLAWRALRLTAVHADSATQGTASLVMWARADEGLTEDPEFATFRHRYSHFPAGAVWSGDSLDAFATAEHELRLRAIPAQERRIARSGMSKVPEGTAWGVDGHGID